MGPRVSTTLLTVGFILTQIAVSGTDSQSFSALLREHGAVSTGDLKRLSESGAPFAKVLANVRKGEVAVVGAVRIPVTVDFFIDRFREIETFRKAPAVLSIGKFDQPPQQHNLEKLTLDEKELNTLALCRPGKCGLKLSSKMIDRLRSDAVNLGPGPKLENVFRATLFDYLLHYMENGTPAMIVYGDTDPPVSSSRVFLDLLGEFAWLGQYAPLLFETLRDSIHHEHPQIEEFFYWSKDSFGLKPVISVTQVLIVKTKVEDQPWTFVASKQICADHYFEASLGLTVIAEESADPANPLISIAYFNRSQTDGLRGWLASIERSFVERSVRKGLREQLSEMKDRIGQAYGDRPR